LAEHNAPVKVGAKYTHKNGPWTLVWAESHPTRVAAMAGERQIKAMRSARWIREHLLHQVERVPARRD
jgi:predicted GIY-YIG superfamily endonuclease